ncbi:MAG: hypothetical protein IIW01_08455, partial [Thermoguttaceae bacterium]|nr:hypothetical protein [Thermoguttaceae bacterium]
MKRNEENDGAKSRETLEALEAFEDATNGARVPRRQALKTGALGLATAALGGGSVFAQGGGRGRGRGRGFSAASEVSAENVATANDEFPYHLDGCKTFSEYKALRKRERRPCDPVVVEADNPSLTYERRRCANCGRCDEACMAQTI